MNKKQHQYCKKCNLLIAKGQESLDETVCQSCWESLCAKSFWDAIVDEDIKKCK